MTTFAHCAGKAPIDHEEIGDGRKGIFKRGSPATEIGISIEDFIEKAFALCRAAAVAKLF